MVKDAGFVDELASELAHCERQDPGVVPAQLRQTFETFDKNHDGKLSQLEMMRWASTVVKSIRQSGGKV